MTMLQNPPAPQTTRQFVIISSTPEPTPAQRRAVWAGVLLGSQAAWGVLGMGAGAIVSAI